MGIRVYKPTSAGRRNASVSDFAELTPGYKPERSLRRPKRKTGGRNNQGKITARHRGGGHKQWKNRPGAQFFGVRPHADAKKQDIKAVSLLFEEFK